MNILLVAQHYFPEEVSGAALATELAEDLAKKGHRVTFVTSAPSYPYGKVFQGYRNPIRSTETVNGVRIIRVWSYITSRKSFLARTLNFISFSLFALIGGLPAGRPDILFSYSPPLPLGLSAWLLSRLWRIPWVLRVEDLFPDAAVAAGVLRNRFAIALSRKLERFLYRRANHISVISEGFRSVLLSKGVPAEKISVEPVWADPNQVKVQPRENAFRAEHGLQGKFVILYAGNIGLTSSLDEVLWSAEALRDDADVLFLLVGEGARKAELIERVRQRALKNVRFLPFQPRERLSEMLAAADISLVTLNSASARYSLPSKTFTNMASARPIIAVCPKDSQLAELIFRAQCGIVVPPGEYQALVSAVQLIRQNAAFGEQMGFCGRRVLEEQFSRQSCVDQYEQMIQSVADH